jgi:hypothetical protein
MAWLAECELILAQVVLKLKNQNQASRNHAERITGQRISMRCTIQTGEEDREVLQQENQCLARNLAALRKDFEYVLTHESVEKAQLLKSIDFLKQALKEAQEELNPHARKGDVGELMRLSEAEGQPAEAAALREELDKSRGEKSELKQEIMEIRLELQDQILRLEAEGAETAALREKNSELHAEVKELKNAPQEERGMVSGVEELQAEVVRLKAALVPSESALRRLSEAEGQPAEAAALREELDKSRGEKSELKQEIMEIRLELQDQILRLEAEGAEINEPASEFDEARRIEPKFPGLMDVSTPVCDHHRSTDRVEEVGQELVQSGPHKEMEQELLLSGIYAAWSQVFAGTSVEKKGTAMAGLLSGSEKDNAKTFDDGRCLYGQRPKIWRDDPRQRSGGVAASLDAPETLEASRVSLEQQLLEPKQLVIQPNANNAGTSRKLAAKALHEEVTPSKVQEKRAGPAKVSHSTEEIKFTGQQNQERASIRASHFLAFQEIGDEREEKQAKERVRKPNSLKAELEASAVSLIGSAEAPIPFGAPICTGDDTSNCFECEYNCGYLGTFDDVHKHEVTCSRRPAAIPYEFSSPEALKTPPLWLTSRKSEKPSEDNLGSNFNSGNDSPFESDVDDDHFLCKFNCGYDGKFDDVHRHELSCSLARISPYLSSMGRECNRLSVALSDGPGMDTGEPDDESRFVCEFDCGYAGRYDEVCVHEANCRNKPSTRSKLHHPIKREICL